MSHKNNARLIWVNATSIVTNQINFIGIKSSHRTVTSHMYHLYKNNHRLKTSTNLFIDDNLKYEKIWKLMCVFVCFVALCPKSTAMVIAGQSVHLTTLFPGQA